MTDLAIRPNTDLALHAPKYTPAQIELIKRTVAKDATDDEFAVFLYQAYRRGLDPMVRQLHFVKRGNTGTIQTGIDGYRLIAQRTGLYNGQAAPQWAGDAGIWCDVWISPTPPAAAKVGVYRKGVGEPVIAVALWSEYRQTTKEGSLAPMWARMPALMLSKCAEALALRKAFPEELSGIYTDDEMGQEERAAPAQVNGRALPGPSVRDLPHTTTASKPAKPKGWPTNRLEAQAWYGSLIDRARVLGLPSDDGDCTGSDREILLKGKALIKLIREAEAAIPTPADVFAADPETGELFPTSEDAS